MIEDSGSMLCLEREMMSRRSREVKKVRYLGVGCRGRRTWSRMEMKMETGCLRSMSGRRLGSCRR
jgi:hypothetical protein